MKGDFSRLRFNPAKNYTSVLQQQGRVSLDSDANEQAIIDEYLRAEEITDIIGKYGGPKGDCGFKITFNNDTGLHIGRGRYYVEGIACENDKDLTYFDQPYLITTEDDEIQLFQGLKSGAITTLQVYLQVWRRLVTSLDDPCLREPALGMADTTARLQTVWRVIVNPIYASTANMVSANEPAAFVPAAHATNTNVPAAHATETNQSAATPAPETNATQASQPAAPAQTAEIPALEDKILLLNQTGERVIDEPSSAGVRAPSQTIEAPVESVGQQTIAGSQTPVVVQTSCCESMTLSSFLREPGRLWARTSDSSDDCSCEPTPASGYRGLENQLYRVEVHTSGDATTATFKWSRENASVVVAISSVSGKQVFVDSLGPDANLGFNHNDWVEISDDTDLFGDTPNQAGTLYQIDSISRENLSITMKSAVGAVNLGRNPRLRRWDQSGTGAVAAGIAIARSQWFTLENGIEVQFTAGTYTTGDYWLIPARTATGNIEWPPCGGEGGKFQPALNTPIYHAPLACITLNDPDAFEREALTYEANNDEIRQDSQFNVQDCRKCFSPLTALTKPTAPTAMHVTATTWRHDDIVTADYLVARGLGIAFDQEIASPITGGNFIVTLENVDAGSYQAAAALESWSILRDLFILETSGPIVPTNRAASGTAKASAILRWTLPYTAQDQGQLQLLSRLSGLLNAGASEGRFARVRVRLMGRAIYSGSGASQLYLDGQVFGEAGTREDGDDRIELKFPSGNGEKASDFESWFYVAPELVPTSVTTAITIPQAPTNQTEFSGPTAQPTATATVTLSYPPIKSVTVHLTLTLQSGVGSASSYITVPSTLTFNAGEQSQQFNMTIVSLPPAGVAENFQLSASLTPLVGPANVVSTNFTLN